MPRPRRIAGVISASGILISAGIVCLVISAYMAYLLMPREGRGRPGWVQTDFAETGVALTQFTLLIAGIALLVKGFAS